MLQTIQSDGSDLHLNPGRPPVIRINGGLTSIGHDELTNEATEALGRELCQLRDVESGAASRGQAGATWSRFEADGTIDFGLMHESGNRFRVSVMRQRGRISSVLRLIPNRLLSFEQIGLPESAIEVLRRPRGLILVTGPTGSGKTTTLASMIDWINENQSRHIVTIEDPVEYYHTHKRGLVTQREVGSDVPDFPEAMRRVLRQDPDVILLGEMRDLETISAAITAAETGHLVFGTLHTTGSARTMDRIIDAFPANQQEQIRAQLSVSIVAVISQVLLPTADGRGRCAAFEVMLMNSAIANLIRKNETNKIQSTLQTSRRHGMVTLDDYLVELVAEGRISRDVAIDAAQDVRDVEARV